MSGLLEFRGGLAQFRRGLSCCVVVWAVSACSDSNSNTTDTFDADRDGIPDGEESLIARFDPNLGGPGTPELCDGRDNDGDNLVDEDTGCAACE